VMFGSYRDCAGKSVMNCLQAFPLTGVYAVEKGIAVIKLGMRWLLCKQSCKQVLGVVDGGRQYA